MQYGSQSDIEHSLQRISKSNSINPKERLLDRIFNTSLFPSGISCEITLRSPFSSVQINVLIVLSCIFLVSPCFCLSVDICKCLDQLKYINPTHTHTHNREKIHSSLFYRYFHLRSDQWYIFIISKLVCPSSLHSL